MANEKQETRSERATIAVTPTEKQALRVLAAIRETSEGELLRAMRLHEVVTEYGRTLDRMRQEAA